MELKSIERFQPTHKKQVFTWLRLVGMTLGYLLSFGEALKNDDITHIVGGES